MNDIRIYARNAERLNLALKIVEMYTREIEMEFVFDKCAKIRLKRGRPAGISDDPELFERNAIQYLDFLETYQCLVVPKSRI